ncbi:MAG: hypothetical protein ACRD3T_17250 [Terriglobia bacterium]
MVVEEAAMSCALHRFQFKTSPQGISGVFTISHMVSMECIIDWNRPEGAAFQVGGDALESMKKRCD